MVRWLAVLIVLAGLSGCARQPPVSAAVARASVEKHLQLQHTLATRHVPLRDELTRLAAECALPKDIALLRQDGGSGPAGWRDGRGELIEDDQNIATVLRDVFADQSLDNLHKRIDGIYPSGRVEISEQHYQRIRDWNAKYQSSRLRIQIGLKRPHCQFNYQYAQGLLADFDDVRLALAANRLLGLYACEQLVENDLIEALDIWESMLILPAHLTRASNLTARATAARLRSEAWRIMEALAHHRDFDAAAGQRVLDRLEQHQQQWGDEKQNWIGERAMGMHAYEMVRDGHLLSLLEFRQLQLLKNSKSLPAYCQSILQHLDEDELFYLRTMREVIAHAGAPYPERRKHWMAVQRQLEESRRTSSHPRLAEEILLRDIEWGLRLQASDRALCGAWETALRESLGLSPSTSINPLTGQPYRVERHAHHIAVWDVDLQGDGMQLGDDPLVLRRLTIGKAAASAELPNVQPR